MDKKQKIAVGVGVVMLAGATVLVVSRPTKGGTTPPVGTATLFGVVTNSDTGNPLADVTVSLGSQTTSTDGSGAYSFTGLEIGKYAVTFDKGEYMKLSNSDVTLVAGMNELNVALVPSAVPPTTATLYGAVSDASTGEPLQGVSVTVDGATPHITDSSGYYSFTGLSVGGHTVTFTKTDYNTETR